MNQMEIFKNPEFGSIRVVEETAGICSAERMWPLLWGIAIPAMRCVGTARES